MVDGRFGYQCQKSHFCIEKCWKSRARLTPEGKAALTPENLFVLTPVKS